MDRSDLDSGARMAALVWHSADAIIASTIDGVIEVWNPAAERIFGWSAAEALGRHVSFYAPPERAAEQAELVGRACRGETVGVETQRLTRDGGRIDVLLRITPMRDAGGRIVGHAGSLQDISDRRRAEAALRASEATLRAFYDNAPVCMGVVEPTGDGDVLHLYDNPVTCRVFGVAPGATTGRLASELGAKPETLAIWREHYAASRASGRPSNFEFQLEMADGRHWFTATVCAIGVGESGRMRYCYVCEDTSERHRAAARLRTSEAHARLALQVAHAGTWRWDSDKDEVHADARCREIAGLPGDVLLRLADITPRIHPDDRARIETALGAALEGRPYAEEFRFVHADGSERWVVSHGQLLPPEAGAQASRALLGTVYDITRRKADETLLRDADRRKDEFLATLAHELRNPLAPIASSVQILRRVNASLPAADKPLAVMERQLVHMVRLIDDLLDLSRVSSDKLELRTARLDLAQVVAHAVETSRPLIDAARHELNVSLPAHPLVVLGDLTRLSQVLANLLNNAARYTPPRGHIRLAVVRDDASAASVIVEDDGIGIPPEVLPGVFDMFTQVDRRLERAPGGLGIGLAIAMRLVRLHGGRLEVSSAGAGQGSRFVVHLPLAPAASAREGAPPPPPAPPAASRARRILIADDNADSADSLAELLRLLGHETRVAHDGEAALALAESFRPEIALLDIGMPRRNGYEVARALRAAPWARAMTLVAVTGWGQADDRRRSREAGFDAHIVKPVELAALEPLLRPGTNASHRDDTSHHDR